MPVGAGGGGGGASTVGCGTDAVARAPLASAGTSALRATSGVDAGG
jgi:hypothetical protein